MQDWPDSSVGVLHVRDGLREWVIRDSHTGTKTQWVANVSGWSTHYAHHPLEIYGAGRTIGPPQTRDYGDSVDAWAPRTIDGGCVNRATDADPHDHFYTEYIETTFAQPVYLNALMVVENQGGDRITRIQVPRGELEGQGPQRRPLQTCH